MSGSIREKKQGYWELRVSTGRRNLKGQYIYKSKTFKGSKTQAQKELAKFAIAVEDMPIAVESSSLNLRAFAKIWMTDNRKDWATNTFKFHAKNLKYVETSKIGNLKLKAIKPLDLEAFYSQLLDSGLSATTVRGVHRTVNAVLKTAQRFSYIAVNPAMVARQPRGERFTAKTISLVDVNRVIEMASSPMDLIIRLAVVTGLRRSELLALKWGDLNDGVLTVGFSVDVVGGEFILKPTKTGIVKRIGLDSQTLMLLDAHREVLNAGVDDWVFGEGDRKLPVHPDTLSHRWIKLAREAGLDGVRFHDLRHATATHLIASGVDVRSVAGHLGHASPTMTLNVYSHALPSGARNAQIIADGLGEG